ncbi:MAG: two component transcriptional regulator, LytTR family [Acidobacteria bacterium]|nr:two component transcriptional regulator, LytTR family [Acidobacteriota bacterium]
MSDPQHAAMTTVIVDDEPLGRKLVRQLIRDYPDFRLVGEAATVARAAALIVSLRPDVVFLDVALGDGDAFDVLNLVGPSYSSVTIFITAHDQHAIRAFDVEAVDYLLKPIKRDRFRQAINRARQLCDGRRPPVPRREEPAPPPAPPRDEARPRHLAVSMDGDRLLLLSVDEIDWIESERNYVRVRAGAVDNLFRESLIAVERRLDPRKFVRIHRSVIVNVDRITHLEPNAYGDYVIVLADGTRLPLSRRYRERLGLLLGHL